MPGPVRTLRGGNVTTIEMDGPFFTHNPRATFRENIRTMMDALAAEAESDVRAQLASRTSTVRAVGYTKGMRTGKRWALSAAVNADTRGMDRQSAIRAQAILYGRRKGDHGVTLGVEARWKPFAKTKNRMRRAQSVNKAELAKGMT